MEKDKTQYAIYRYDFHRAASRTLLAEADGVDGEKSLKHATECFASLFDLNSIDSLAKNNAKGEFTRLPNDVMKKQGNIIVWRVNNSQIKEWWGRNGKTPQGIDVYERQEVESNPYCYVLIDLCPSHCLMAIEKSAAWASNTDKVRDMLLENFNRLLADRFDLEMRIDALMNPTEFWDFVHQRIFEHGDHVKRICFTFQNPKKTNAPGSVETKNRRLANMLQTVEIMDALKGYLTMEFDQNSSGKFSPKNRDLAEMVRLCSGNGYDISITFSEYKVYRINQYVKAFYELTGDILQDFKSDQLRFGGRTDLEVWFDMIDQQTKDFINETEIPTRR